MAGLRAGYCVASSAVCRFLNRIREPFNVNRVAVVACQASLADHDFLARCLENNRLGRAYLMEQFRRLGMDPVASQADFVLGSAASRAPRSGAMSGETYLLTP